MTSYDHPHFTEYERALAEYDSNSVRSFLDRLRSKVEAAGQSVSLDMFDAPLEHHLHPWFEHSTFWGRVWWQLRDLIDEGRFDDAIELAMVNLDSEHTWQLEIAQVISLSAVTESSDDSVTALITKIASRACNDGSLDMILPPYLVWMLQAWGCDVGPDVRRYLEKMTSTHFDSYLEPSADTKRIAVDAMRWAAVECRFDEEYHPANKAHHRSATEADSSD